MAAIIWTDKASKARQSLYVNGVLKFGPITASKMARKIESIADKLERFPELGYREPLLQGCIPIYRTIHINKRFKIIYWYDEVNDMVVIEDIWDMWRSPQNLEKRIGTN